MSKNTRKYYADDGVTLLKIEETTISTESNDINKVSKKITNYKSDGKVEFVEETEDFYNSKTGEKINPAKKTDSIRINSNAIISAYIPYGVAIRKYDMVDPCATTNHNFGQFLYASFPSAFSPAKIF